MRPHTIIPTIGLTALLVTSAGYGAQTGGFGLDVLVSGETRPEYHGRGAVFVEAVRGSEYTLRITNPLGVRVAVALAVDGLNTIDARHTDARSAAKWVLGPYESVEVPGWQVSGSTARAFIFTGEKSSYGAWLGETANLGVIEAAFFREKPRPMPVLHELAPAHGGSDGPAASAPAPAGAARGELKAESAAALSDELAATGIGERRRHEVERVSLELEREPAAVVRLRYEFRPQLERLGLLPVPGPSSPLERREHASGFSGGYCPDSPGR